MRSAKRNLELLLLILVFTLFFLGFSLVSLAFGKDITLESLSPAFMVVGVFFLAHLTLRILAKESDPTLLPISALLACLGLIMIDRLKSELLGFQILWLVVGIFFLALTLFFFKDYKILKNYKYITELTGIGLLLSPIFFGYARYGAKLWISLGPFSFQPAELAKILLVVFFAAYLQEKKELLSSLTYKLGRIWVPEPKHLGPLVTMWGLSLVILVFERDLGSSLLFFGIFLSLLYVATARGTYVGIGTLLFLGGATACYFLFSHVRVRVDVWLNPWADIAGSGYQIAQSLFAIGSGGLFGAGLARGFPQTIPAVYTDFIFSALAEELGLLGASALILSYLFFIWRGFKIALVASDEFGKLLAVGLTSVLALQTFVIIGGTTKLIPLTGVTLPLVSYGGSSILANFILLGLLLAISNQAAQEGK